MLSILIFEILTGIFFAVSLTMFIITRMLEKNNDIGNTKGKIRDYNKGVRYISTMDRMGFSAQSKFMKTYGRNPFETDNFDMFSENEENGDDFEDIPDIDIPVFKPL